MSYPKERKTGLKQSVTPSQKHERTELDGAGAGGVRVKQDILDAEVDPNSPSATDIIKIDMGNP